MSEQPYTTRDEAAAPPADLVRMMAKHAYEAGRPKGSGRPEFDATTQQWQAVACHEMRAALDVAIKAGRIEVKS